MKELPINCLFNKGVPGCGGTELALRNDLNTIIAMPFISLVINKAEQEKHKDKVLGVYGGVSDYEIEEYIKTHKTWKIAVVYDSLPKVIDVFQKLGVDPYEKCFLLVDEYHLLFNQYVFRETAVRKLLELAPKFKAKTYMTATPTSQEFMLKELNEIPVCEVTWPNKMVITVNVLPTSSPQRSVMKLIQDKLDDKFYYNLHFFVNSVKFIAGILKRLNISPDDVKIVCANNETNARKLSGYKIGKPSDESCKINFYTSTCFEGCDLFDKDGKTFVVSSGRNPNTLYDISTLFIQIIGRIRDSDYKDNVTHIVSSSNYKGEVSYQDFKALVEKEYQVSKTAAEEYNSQEKALRKERFDRLGKGHFIDRFMHIDDNYKFVLDINLLNKALIDYKLKNDIYSKSFSLRKEYRENGLNVNSLGFQSFSDKLKYDSSARICFKDVVEEYYIL